MPKHLTIDSLEKNDDQSITKLDMHETKDIKYETGIPKQMIDFHETVQYETANQSLAEQDAAPEDPIEDWPLAPFLFEKIWLQAEIEQNEIFPEVKVIQ